MKDLKTIESGINTGEYFVIISNGDFGAIYQFDNRNSAADFYIENKMDVTEDRYEDYDMSIKQLDRNKIDTLLKMDIENDYYYIAEVINNGRTISKYPK